MNSAWDSIMSTYSAEFRSMGHSFLRVICGFPACPTILVLTV